MTSCHIVFLPGLFARGWVWNDVAKDCRKQEHTVTVIEPSIPEGFGGKLENAHTVIQDCLYRKAGSGPAILVGNSMSALIALDFASKYPDAVDGLIMSGAPGLDELDAGVSLVNLRNGCPDSAQILGDRVLYDKDNISEKDYHKGTFDIQQVFSSHDTFKYIVKWLNISRKYQVLENLPNVKCPIQLLWGDHDLITPGEPWEALAKDFDSLTYQEVIKCGHSPMFEKPYDFLTLMYGYIEAVTHPLAQTA